MDKFIIKAPKPLDVSTEAALSRAFDKTDLVDVVNQVKDITSSSTDEQLEALKALESNELEFDEDSASLIASLYWDVVKSRVALQTVNDKMKNLIREEMEAEGKSTVEASVIRAKFQLSKPNVTVSYDVDSLKTERPDVYDRCTDFSGKPMSDEERADVENDIAKLQKLLADLNKKIVEDNAAKTPIFNEKLFQSMANEDDTLKKFIDVKTAKPRLYFKEMKDDAE